MQRKRENCIPNTMEKQEQAKETPLRGSRYWKYQTKTSKQTYDYGKKKQKKKNLKKTMLNEVKEGLMTISHQVEYK